eukprot:4974469-Pleurochrysis_carterae.AAC.1
MQPQVAEWKALFDFHTQYETSDSVPPLPVELSLPEGRSMVLTGMPIPWSQLWGKLGARFPRQHHSSTGGATSHHVVPKASDPAAVATQELPLPLQNSVTGINYQEADRRNAAAL